VTYLITGAASGIGAATAELLELGVHPEKLLAIFDRAEKFGLDVQCQRRPS
jgi:NADP-dependent 3-hydroxy acid dehydrogenase YdfG